MLLGNYSVLNRNPIRFFGGGTATPEVNHQSNFCRGGCRKNRQYVEQTTSANKQFSLSTGTYPPYMLLLPQKGGDMTARRSGDFALTATATGGRGRPGTGTASFAITTNAPYGQLIVSGSGSAAFSITANTPALTASVNGAGSSSVSIAVNAPTLGAIARKTGTATFAITTNAPTMYPLDDSSPLRTGSASFSFSGSLTRYAVGHMTGSALPYTELSPQSLAAAVWDSMLTDYQLDGSAGKSLSTASSGGVDLNLMAQAVWEYVSRTLTEGASPSESDIVAALQATTIPVDVRKMNGSTLLGNGTESDKWRGSGV